MRVLIVTACGTEKNPRPMTAIKLYKSSRVKAIYNRRGSSDMCILSAEYGLVNANDIIKPYERVMDERRAKELMSSVAEKIQDYDYVIFFKGGARKAYLTCIEDACKQAGKSLVILGFANIGGVNDLPVIINLLKRKRLTELSSIKHVKVFFNKPINTNYTSKIRWQ